LKRDVIAGSPIQGAYTLLVGLCYLSLSHETLVSLSGGARILEQVGPEAGPKVVW